MFRYRQQFYGTIKPAGIFNPNQSAQSLHDAMKGFGCNKESIINHLTRVNNQQRQEISYQYATMYGKDLTRELKKELHGDFEDTIVALMMTPSEYDVHSLHDAIHGLGTKEKVLIEILCSRTNEQILLMRAKYEELYHHSLESAVKGDTSGDFENLLVALLQGNRDESNMVDSLKANQEAHQLYNDGERMFGTHESTFNRILVAENFFQLKQIFADYQEISGHSIETAIKNEFSGDIREGLLALAQNIENQPGYFAQQIHNAVKGFGTHDKELIRIIVTRSEIDLALIREQYEALTGKALAETIRSECSGAYRDTLIAIVNGN